MVFSGLPLTTLAYLAGGVAAAVTLLYLLKLRKRRVEVPFSPLWGRVLSNYKRQTSWWRRVRRILSWLLQLLLVALLALALADPHPEQDAITGRHLVLLVDNSASMASTDVSGGVNRFDLAKRTAQQLLETLGPEDRVMLVAFNEQLQPLSPFVAEASLLEGPLQKLEVVASGTSFPDALEFAAQSLRDKANGELVVLSDGAGLSKETLDQVDVASGTTVRHIQLGESGGNVGITGFTARRYVANKLDYELFVQVRNYFARPIQAELQIYADGRLVDAKPLRLPPQGVLQSFYPSQAVSGEKLEARVKVTSLDARDVFPLDDSAYALLPEVRRARVRLVTEGNLYLEGPLLLNPNIELTRVKPQEYDPNATQYDITIFDRVDVDLPKSGNLVFFDPRGARSPWSVEGTVEAPLITSTKKSHPLMRWIALNDANIGEASRFDLERGDEVVVSAMGVPLIVTRNQDRRRLVGFAFDLRNSDLPLRVAFPVLLINLVDYFQLDDDRFIPNYKTGQTFSVKLTSSADETESKSPQSTPTNNREPAAVQAQVTGPSGESWEVPLYQGKAVIYATRPGFYQIESSAGRSQVAVNLANPEESRVEPAEMNLPERQVEREVASLFFDRKEYWIWAALFVLGLLLFEWITYNRKWTV